MNTPARTSRSTPQQFNPALAREFSRAFAGNDQLGEVIDTITGVVNGTIRDLAQWVADVPKMIQTMVNQVVDIFNGIVVTPINNAIQGVLDWFRGLLGFREDTSEHQQETENTVNNQGVILSGIRDDLVDTAEKADLPNNLPMWQTLNPLEDPTFPRILINKHQQPGAFYIPDQDRVEIAFIRSPRARRYNTIGCIVDNRDGKFTGDLRLGMYRLAPNGELQLQEVSENLAAQVPLAIVEVRTELQEDYPVQPREYLAVGILMSGGTSCGLAGIEDEWIAAPVGTYPPRSNALSPSGTTEMPEVITSGETDFSQAWIPWACLGESIEQIDQKPLSYRDTFDRPDGALGHSWASRGQILVRDRKARHGQQYERDGYATALWVYPLNSDNQESSVVYNNTGAATGYPSFVMLRANSLFTRGMVAYARPQGTTAAYIGLSRAVGVNQYEDVRELLYGVSPGDRLTLRAVGNTYIVSLNGYEVIEESDPDHEWVEPGPEQRFVGFGTSGIGNERSPDIEDWRAKDLNRELLEYPAEDRYPSRLTYLTEPSTGTGGGDGDDAESED